MKTLRHLLTKYKSHNAMRPKALTSFFTTHASRSAARLATHSAFSNTPETSAMMRAGYHKNVIVHRAVNLIARAASSVPLVLYVRGKKVADHPLLSLLQQPNPFQGLNVLVESVISHLLISGNAYIEAISNTRSAKTPNTECNPPLELHTLRPERVRVVPGAFGLPRCYEYTVYTKTRRIDVNPLTGSSRLLHLKLFNPDCDWYGLSPLVAAAKAIACHNTVAQHNLSLLENGGRPSGALFFGRKNGMPLTDRQRENIRESVNTVCRGVQNAGQMLVLEGDVEWKDMGFSPKDMDFSDGKNTSAREIAQVFGVPPMLVGVPGDATFSNYREARLHLWEDTILPLLNRLINQLNAWLAPQFGESLKLAYDADQIPPLAAKRDMAWDRMNQCTFLTRNEKRVALGYPEIKGGGTLEVTG